jgi:HK97 family phage major capsid protein
MRKIALMGAHFAAFQAAAARHPAAYERRDAPDTVKLVETIDKIGRAFEEYKSANDTRLAEFQKKGASDPVLDAKLQKLDAELDSLAEVKKSVEELATRAARPGGQTDQRLETPSEKKHKESFLKWMRNPADPQATMDLKAAQSALETRATQTTGLTGAAGGFAVPEQIEQTIARLTRDISPIRQIATVRAIGSSDYKELFDVNGATGEWVGETATRSQTNTNDLAEVAPTMGTMSARPRASEESLDDIFFNVESWLGSSVAETHAAMEGAAFVGGNGTNSPTGFLAGPTPVVTADAARAFGTLQYIASGGAAALPTSADVFLDMVYGLRARYRANARWVTSRSVLGALRKYKDSTGQYLWQPSMSAGQPESFMGYGVTEAEDMPIVAANAFPLAFGDFREGYLIVDRVGLRSTRDEITLPGFVQWYVRKRVGGKIRNSQAIKLLKIATS